MFWIAVEALGHALLPSKFENVFAWDLSSWARALFGIPFYLSPLYSPLWYVRDLFILSIIAPIIHKPLKKYPYIFGVIASAVWFAPLPNGLRESITFFIMGGIISTHKMLKNNCKEIVGVPQLVVVLLIAAILSLTNNEVAYKLSILLMIVVIYIVCVKIIDIATFKDMA